MVLRGPVVAAILRRALALRSRFVGGVRQSEPLCRVVCTADPRAKWSSDKSVCQLKYSVIFDLDGTKVGRVVVQRGTVGSDTSGLVASAFDSGGSLGAFEGIMDTYDTASYCPAIYGYSCNG